MLLRCRAVNTPAHLIFGAAAFARSGQKSVTTAAVVGSFLPDLSLYGMVIWSINLKGISPRVVFGEYYFSVEWQSVFAVDNSFPLWGLVLLGAMAARWPAGVAFAGAGLLHLLADFALHHDDARMMLWPLSTWVVRSPLSYYDGDHFGQIVGPIEIALSLLLCGLLWRRFQSLAARLLIGLAGLMEAAPGVLFALMFRN